MAYLFTPVQRRRLPPPEAYALERLGIREADQPEQSRSCHFKETGKTECRGLDK